MLQRAALVSSISVVLVTACTGVQRVPEGCGKDTDCLGGRICSAELRCIEPPPSSAARIRDAGPVEVESVGEPFAGPQPFAMFGGNARHTGALAGAAPKTRPAPVWQLEIGQPIVGSPTLGPDGTIYVTSHDRKLYAVSPGGVVKWSFETGDRIWSTPAVAADGTIYVGSDDDHLYAVDGISGQEKWRFRVGDCADPIGFGPEGSRCDADGGPTLGPDGTIYIGGDGVHAVWANGTLRWKFATAEHVSTAPALAPDGTVYAGSLGDAVYAINPDGTKRWELRGRRDIESSPAIGADGTVYVGSDDDVLMAIDGEGELAWKVITGGDVRASPAIADDGTIYVGSYDHDLYAVTPSGSVAWRFATAGKIHGSAGVARNGIILVGSQDDHVYAIDPDGRLLWYLEVGGDVDTTPALSSDGTLYVAGDDGTLRAFR